MPSNKIRGITIELGADTSGISKALGGLNADLSSTTKQLKDVDRLLKLDPKNTQLLEQKQRLLGDAIGTTKEKLSQLEKAQQAASAEVEKGTAGAQKGYDAITREIAATKAELKKFEDQAKTTSAQLNDFVKVAGEIGKTAGDIANKTKGMSAASAGLATALLGNAYAAAQAADDINTLAKRTGISTDMIQQMRYATDLIDVSVEDMTTSIQKLSKKMADGNTAFDTLGVSVRNADGSLRNAEDVWWDTLDALSKLPNETEKDALAMQLFEEGASKLAGVIDDGGESLRTLGQEANDAGLILSGDALNNANAFNDGIDQLKATASAAFMEAGASLATTLLPALETLVTKVGEVLTWFGSLDGGTQTLILTVLGLVASIAPIAGLISTIGGAITTLAPVVAGISAAFTAAGGAAGIMGAAIAAITSPIGIAVAAIAGLIAVGVALWKNWDTIKQKASDIWNGIKTAIANAMAAIKLPHFSISGQFSIVPPSVPKLKIDWYKEGGILNGAQIFGAMGNRLLGGGEAGAEAVLPLNSFYQHLSDIMANTDSGRPDITVNVTASFADASDRNLDELADTIGRKIAFKIQQEGRAFK